MLLCDEFAQAASVAVSLRTNSLSADLDMGAQHLADDGLLLQPLHIVGLHPPYCARTLTRSGPNLRGRAMLFEPDGTQPPGAAPAEGPDDIPF